MNLVMVHTENRRKLIPSCNLAKSGEESYFQILVEKDILEIAVELESFGFEIWQDDGYFLCCKAERDYLIEIRLWENVDHAEIYPAGDNSAENFYYQFQGENYVRSNLQS